MNDGLLITIFDGREVKKAKTFLRTVAPPQTPGVF